MKSFKKMFESKRSFKMCLFDGKEQRWPVIDGWTQKISDVCSIENSNVENYMIEYYNDKKYFNVTFIIERDNYFPENFKGNWIFNDWGKTECGAIKSEKNIKAALKKADILYEKAKEEGKKKIPNMPEWKRIVNDYEIAYSRKQKNLTCIVKITSIHGFIKNLFGGFKVCVYNDSMNDRVTEKEFYIDSKRSDFKSKMSDINDKFFKS